MRLRIAVLVIMSARAAPLLYLVPLKVPILWDLSPETIRSEIGPSIALLTRPTARAAAC